MHGEGMLCVVEVVEGMGRVQEVVEVVDAT